MIIDLGPRCIEAAVPTRHRPERSAMIAMDTKLNEPLMDTFLPVYDVVISRAA